MTLVSSLAAPSSSRLRGRRDDEMGFQDGADGYKLGENRRAGTR